MLAYAYMKAWVETQEGEDHGGHVASEGDDAPVVRYTKEWLYVRKFECVVYTRARPHACTNQALKA